MKSKTYSSSVLALTAVAFAGLVLSSPLASAAIVLDQVTGTELEYETFVSTTDLLHGNLGTVSGFNPTGGTTAALTDGIHGRSFATASNVVEGAWTMVGANATYQLGVGAGGQGWDITSIQTIAAWTNVGFGNQAYTVDVQLVGAAGFTPLATVNYQPINTDAPSATKVTLTDDTGVLVSGVQAIRFTANTVNGGVNGGAFVFREIDVNGVATVPEPSAAILLGFAGLAVLGRRTRK